MKIPRYKDEVELTTEIGERLKYIRKKILKLNQKTISKNMGISQNYFSYIETGKRTINIKMLKYLKTTYNINLNWFLTGEGPIFNEENSSEITKELNMLSKNHQNIVSELIKTLAYSESK